MTIEIEILSVPKSVLGECPVWRPEEQALYWEDIDNPHIHRLHPETGSVASWALPEEIGCFAFRRGGGVIAAMRSGFSWVDLETGSVEIIADPELDKPNNRFNDGKCDRAGRMWSGTMGMDFAPGVGAVYRLDPDLTCRKMIDGFTVPNGMAWSPDNKTFYISDSRRNTVFAYDYDFSKGDIANPRTFISTENIPARVDGATVDRDGCYWCAHIHGWEVAQYDPDGTLMRTIKLPIQHPSMVCFGGPDLDVIYVTSLTTALPPEQRHLQPLAGSLFAIYGSNAVGIAEPNFMA